MDQRVYGLPRPTRQAPHDATRGYLGHKRPDWERADLAAKAYLQKRPIEAPTLHQIAFAYRVSVGSIQRRLNTKRITVDIVERLAQAPWQFPPGVPALSDCAVENIVAKVGVERIWQALDKLTQPELSLLVAAE